MINKEFVFSYNLGLIALMNGIIAVGFASCSHSLVLLFPNCTQNHAVTYTKHMDYIIYALSIAIVQCYTGKYHKFVAVCMLWVRSTSNNANDKKGVMFLQDYGDNDFMM